MTEYNGPLTERERAFYEPIKEATPDALRATLLGLLLILDAELIGGINGTPKELAVFTLKGLQSFDETFADDPDATIVSYEAILAKNTTGVLSLDGDSK